MKRVLITGSSGDIGAAIAKIFAKEGYFVYLHFNSNTEKAEALASEIGEDCVKLVQFDIKDRNSVENALKDIEVEVLVNNAGITNDKLFFWMEECDFSDVLDTNVMGVFNVTKSLVGKMMSKKCGAIINISSVSGLVGNIGQTNYAASKGAIISFTKSLALELSRYNIRVNCVAPGMIESDMTKNIKDSDYKKLIPMSRFGKADEVAEVVYFLAEKATYMTAQVLSVCGGIAR